MQTNMDFSYLADYQTLEMKKPILLPSVKTKAEIHQDYIKLADEMSLRKVCLSEFRTIWLEQCPHVLIMKPATDLCHTCQSFTSTLSASGNLTEEEKGGYQIHIEQVKLQRDHYRDQCSCSGQIEISPPLP